MVKPEDMVVLDRWAVSRALEAQQEIAKAYDEYDFLSVIQRLMHFCSIEMGSFIWISSKTVNTPRKVIA